MRIQATYRGHMARKRLAQNEGQDIVQDDDEEDGVSTGGNDVEFKEEHVFENGAVYRG